MPILAYEIAAAQLLIDADLACDPEALVPGVLPVFVGETMSEGEPHINVVNTGSSDERRNHTGHQVSRPVIRVEAHWTTYAAAWAFGISLQAWCDSPTIRTATRDGATLVVSQIGRTSAVQQLGQHPKTKNYVVGVSIVLSVPSIEPGP